jgi:hypothetical protein
MAIYDQSYTPWAGTYTSRWARIRSIIAMEFALPFRNVWVVPLIYTAFTIVGAWLIVLFIMSSVQVKLPITLGNRIYREAFFNNPFFSIILLKLSATVGSPLIARDVRHRALLMYFSRSITRLDYLLGKFLALLLLLLLVSLLPGLILFLGQLGMGQERLTFGERLADLGSITLHSLILTVPMTSAVLAFSSMTKRAYLAAILWVSFYYLSFALGLALPFAVKAEWPKMLSWSNLTSHLGDLCYAGRGLSSTPILDCGAWPPLLILLSITALSLGLVWRRLRSTEVEE